jgi:hypothetical protein
MHTAAFARARQELEAQARIEARKVAEALHERREEAAARVREISELAATLEKARKAAEAQRVWEASSSARQAAAGRAMALAAKMADDARKRVSSLPPPTIIEDEPVFELSQVCVRPVQNHVPSECELDAMLDDLLDSLEGSDTLPGIPVPGVSDGGMGMTQAKASLRARQGAVAYRPPPTAASMFETVPGLPTGLDTLH